MRWSEVSSIVFGFSFVERNFGLPLLPKNTKPEARNRTRSRLGMVVPLVLLLLTSAPSAEQKQLSIYAPRVSYSLSVSEYAGQDYIGLLEALEPLGKVSAKTEGEKWQLRFNDVESEFRQNTTLGKVAGQKFGLPAPFVLEGTRGLVPLRALPALIGIIVGMKTEYHEAARRLFLAGTATHFTSEPRDLGFSVTFSAPVNPMISTEPGKLTMTFTRDPVVSSTFLMRVENPLVSAVAFSEANGRAELTLEGRAPLLAKFEAGGSTIDIVAAPTEAQSPPQPTAAAPPPPTLQSLTAKPSFVVMLDPGHGGDDRGAQLSDTLEEKTVTLAFARRLRSELQNRGINTVMSRDADVAVPVDQRAAMADAARVGVYITLHAVSQGRGVRVYSAMLNPAAKTAAFLPWDTAQAAYLPASRSLAEIVKAEVARHQVPSSNLSAPVKPLTNVAASAIAVELSPSGSDVGSINAVGYQQRIATGVAEAVVVARSRVEAER